MNQATCSDRHFGDAAKPFVQIVHGGLLLAGLTVLAGVAALHLRGDPINYADVAVIDVQQAPPEVQQSPPQVAPAAPTAAPSPRKPVSTALSEEMQRVRDFVAGRYKVSTRALEPLLVAAETTGRKVGVDPLLIVSVMAIESRFNPFAESSMGAQGLMQVIPRFHLDKIGKGAGEDALFDPVLNIRVGTQVLVEGIRRFGSLQSALQYYGGALNDPDASYANKVLALKRRLMSAAGREGAPAAGV